MSRALHTSCQGRRRRFLVVLTPASPTCPESRACAALALHARDPRPRGPARGPGHVGCAVETRSQAAGGEWPRLPSRPPRLRAPAGAPRLSLSPELQTVRPLLFKPDAAGSLVLFPTFPGPTTSAIPTSSGTSRPRIWSPSSLRAQSSRSPERPLSMPRPPGPA